MKNIFNVLSLFFILSIHSSYGKNTNAFLDFKKDSINAVTIVAPDASLGGLEYKLFNNKVIFSHDNHSNPSEYLFTFQNTSITSATNTKYTFDWGDGSPLVTKTSFTSDEYHNYSPGFYTLLYTVEGPSGTTTQSYDVYLGTTPAISLGNPGGLDICEGKTLVFPITGWENNSSNTTYKVIFGDDPSNPLIFSHPPPSSVTHTFIKTSCGSTGSNGSATYLDSFSASIVATNSCGPSSSAIAPIYVSEKPKADFDLPKDKICLNKSITITNNTTIPKEIVSGSCQNSTSKIVWTISPATGFTLVSGSLGTLNPTYPDSDNLWTIGTQSITPKFTIPGIYTITLRSSNRCGVSIKTKTICVEAPIVPQFTLSTNAGCTPLAVTTRNDTDLTNICSPTYLWSVSYVANNCGSGTVAWSDISTDLKTIANPKFNFVKSGTYTLKLSMTNDCGTVIKTQTVTVKQPPTVTINPITSICQTFPDTTINPTALVNGCAPVSSTLTYAWEFPGGIPATATNANPGAIKYSATGTYTVKLSVTNECGTTVAIDKTFTISPTPTVNTISNQATKCVGLLSDAVTFSGSVPGTTYNWTNNHPEIGLPASGTGNIPAFTVTNSGTTSLTATITVIPKKGGCSGAPMSFTISAFPSPTVNTISDITLCNTASQSSIVFGTTVIGTKFTWTNSDTSIGLAASGTGNIPNFTATNSTNIPVTATITVTPFNATSVCPGGTPKTFTITVNPTPSDLVLNNIEYCGDLMIPQIPFTNSVAGTTYTWTNNKPSIGLAANGNGFIPTFKAINNTSSPIIATITVTPSANGCSGTPKIFTIKVYPTLIVNFSQPDQTICSGTSSFPVTITSTTAAVTFRWSATIPAGITGMTTTSGTNTIPSETLTNNTVAPITITYSAEVTSGTICIGAVYTYTITVNPRPKIANETAITCSEEVFSVNPTNTGTNILPAGTKYTWLAPVSNPAGAIINGTSANNSATISQTVTNTTNSPATLTYTVTPTANGCSGPDFTVTVNVNPKPIVDSVTSFSLCQGVQSSLINFTGNVSGATYNWTSSSTAIGITGSGTDSIPIFTAVNNGTTPLTTTITVTPTKDGCYGIPKTFTITVNPTPTAIVPATRTIVCNNQTSNPIHFTSPVAGTTFAWTNSDSSIGLAGSGTGDIASFTAINNTNTPINATITVTPTANGCSGVPVDYIITVNPTPTVNQPVSLEICNGFPITAISFAGTVTGTNYTWTNTKPSIGLLASGSGDINSFTAVNTTSSPLIATITVTPSANGCSGSPKTFTITVNPSPAVIFSNGNQKTICSGQTSPVTNLTSSSAGVDFSWTTTAVAGISGLRTLSGTNQIPAETLTNTTNAPINIVYSATGKLNGAGTGNCQGIPYTYTVTVNPVPSVTTTLTQTICSDTEFRILPQNGSGNIVPVNTFYTWSNPVISPAGAILGASADTRPQSPIRQTLKNTSNDIATATYTVTPIANGCSGQPFPVVITVNPSAKVNFSGTNQELCNNGTSSIINLSSPTTSNLTFNWTALIPTGITGAATSGTDTIPAQTLTNTTANTLTVVYTATATFDNGISCNGNSYEYKIIVYPELIVSTNSYKHISCFGSNDGTIDINITGGSGTYTYSWTKDGSPFSTFEDLSNLKKGYYEVTVNDSNSCGPKTISYTIEEPPLLDLTFVDKTDILCFGDATGAINVNVIGGRVPIGGYHFAWTGPNGFTATTKNLANIPAGIYNLIVTDDSGCTDDLTVEITQPTEIIVTAVTQQIFCYGGNDGAIDLTITGGVGPYTKVWDNLGHGDSQDNLSAGTYHITVTDANGCTKEIDVIIPDAPLFTIQPVVKQITCFGEKDGSINLNIVGGVAPLSLHWDDNPNAGNIRNNLKEGSYTVTITDAKACIIKRTFVIQEPQLMVLSANVTNALDCDNANSGSINLLVAGGSSPFTYQWNYPAATEDLTNIPAGNYMVTVTDARGCAKTAQYVITRPDPIAIKVSTETFFDCDTKKTSQKFVAQASGGVPPFTYNWSNGETDTTIETDQSGMVILTVNDAIGCAANYTLNIKIPVIGETSFDTNSIGYTTYGIYTIVDPIQFTNTSTGDFGSVSWDFGDGAVSIEENPQHAYQKEGTYVVTQTITYPFGCVYTSTETLKIEKGYEIVTPNAFTPNGDGINETFKPVFEGLSTVQLDVYNSWGELVYTEKGTNLKGWDGRIKGAEAPNGNYYYKLRSIVFYGTVINDGGAFTLIK